jgi:hypothetical protein
MVQEGTVQQEIIKKNQETVFFLERKKQKIVWQQVRIKREGEKI